MSTSRAPARPLAQLPRRATIAFALLLVAGAVWLVYGTLWCAPDWTSVSDLCRLRGAETRWTEQEERVHAHRPGLRKVDRSVADGRAALTPTATAPSIASVRPHHRSATLGAARCEARLARGHPALRRARRCASRIKTVPTNMATEAMSTASIKAGSRTAHRRSGNAAWNGWSGVSSGCTVQAGLGLSTDQQERPAAVVGRQNRRQRQTRGAGVLERQLPAPPRSTDHCEGLRVAERGGTTV